MTEIRTKFELRREWLPPRTIWREDHEGWKEP